MGYGLQVPDFVWEIVAREHKPVALTTYFELYSFTDPVIATVAPALANVFFKLFGSNEAQPGEEPKPL